MKTYVCPRTILIQMLFTALDLKPIEVAKAVHVSPSVLTNYLAGIRKNSNVDAYVIKQLEDFLQNA